MDASGVPTGAVGSSGNLGGGPTQGGAQHGDTTSALGSGDTALGAGQRGGSGGGGVGGLGGGGLGGQGGGGIWYEREHADDSEARRPKINFPT
jgi:hypothetical protein